MKYVKNYNLLFHLHSLMLGIFLYFFFFLPRRVACYILIPEPGIEPVPLAVEAYALTTGQPGKSLRCLILDKSLCFAQKTTKLGFC